MDFTTSEMIQQILTACVSWNNSKEVKYQWYHERALREKIGCLIWWYKFDSSARSLIWKLEKLIFSNSKTYKSQIFINFASGFLNKFRCQCKILLLALIISLIVVKRSHRHLRSSLLCLWAISTRLVTIEVSFFQPPSRWRFPCLKQDVWPLAKWHSRPVCKPHQ